MRGEKPSGPGGVRLVFLALSIMSDIIAVKYGKVLPRKEIGEETSL
jgi:hypothetical protein